MDFPAWVVLPRLPTEYGTFSLISNIVQQTLLLLDEVTQTQGKVRPKALFARELVEVDFSKDLVDGVMPQLSISFRAQFRFCS